MRSDAPPAPTETQKHASSDLPDAFYKSEATISWRDRRGELQTRTISGPTTLGSAPDTALRIADDPLISRIHAEIDPQREGVWIRDLGSRNGTFYEGALVGKIRVPDGANITVGKTVFLVRLAASKNETYLYPTAAYGPLLGRSPEMRALFLKLEQMSRTDSTVLIRGETGTGKELVARVIHEKSPRAAGPFITVDCGALPEDMLDAELFGHVRGSFTGAVADREGAFEAADTGTIFLDEIGELPLAVQPRLLRAIESRTVRRIGEVTGRKIDVRFVAATHRDLREMVNAGTFREDLYFRLAVLPIEVPALRDRPDDIPLLYLHFLPEAMRAANQDVLKLDHLMKRPWKGNVRELRNFTERVVALGLMEALYASDDSVRGPRTGGLRIVGTPGPAGWVPLEYRRGPYKLVRDAMHAAWERVYLNGLVERHGGQTREMVAEAEIVPSYLWKLIRAQSKRE